MRRGVIDRVFRGPGKVMLDAWTGIRSATEHERKVPLLLKDRYGSNTSTPAVASRVNRSLEQCHPGVELDADSTSSLIEDHYSPRSVSAAKGNNKDLEKYRVRIIKITNEIDPDKVMPRGKEGTPNPFLNDRSEDWDIGKVSILSDRERSERG